MITSRVLDICTFPVLGLWRIRTCMFPKYSINSVSVSVFCKKKILYHIWSARLSILLIIKSLFNLLALWYVTRLSILCLLVLSPHSPSISPWLSQDLWDSCPYCLRKYSKYRRDTDWPLQYNSWQEEDCSYSQEVGQLVSLVFRGETRQQVEKVSQSVCWHYPRVPIIIRAPARLELVLHHKYSTLYIKWSYHKYSTL